MFELSSHRGILQQNARGLSLVARFLDFLAIWLAGVVAYTSRFSVSISEFQELYLYPLLIATFLALFIFPIFKLYQSWRGQAWSIHIRQIFLACLTLLIFLAFTFVLLKVSERFSRIWVLYWFFLTFGFMTLFRFTTFYILKALRSGGYNLRRVIIVGAGELGQSVYKAIQDNEWTGYEIICFADDKKELHGQKINNTCICGSIDNLEQTVSENSIDEVWICLSFKAEDRMKGILKLLQFSTVNIKLIPNIFGMELLNHSVTDISGVPVVNLRASPMEGMNEAIKSIEDRIMGFIILILISPVLLLVMLGIKLTSPGPILYKQKRHGWNGRIIKIYKFRSMHVHQESDGQITQASKTDDRITSFGKFLRRTSLDELPQFFNVLQGRMSIVGPRPHALIHNELYKSQVDQYMLRHKVKPGITGWAQVNGLRGETDTLDKMKKRVEYDLYYIQNWSLIFDLKIIILTIFKGFVNKNAY